MTMISYISSPVLTANGSVTYTKSPITNMMSVGSKSQTQYQPKNNTSILVTQLERTTIAAI